MPRLATLDGLGLIDFGAINLPARKAAIALSGNRVCPPGQDEGGI